MKLNLVGEKFERLVVVAKVEKERGKTAYLVRCDCGKEFNVLAQSLRNGATRSCGCLHRDIIVGKFKQKASEFIGVKIGKWMVTGLTPRRAKNGGIYFLCECECGRIREVSSTGLIGGKSKSCGNCGSKAKPFCKFGHEVVLFGGRTPSGSCKACLKEKSLVRCYGINMEDYSTLWESQGGKCAICSKPLGKLFEIQQQGFGRSGRAEVDHVHGTKLPARQTVRGLLCGGRWAGCNRKIGHLDNLDWLKAVLRYLENPPAKVILSEIDAEKLKKQGAINGTPCGE